MSRISGIELDTPRMDGGFKQGLAGFHVAAPLPVRAVENLFAGGDSQVVGVVGADALVALEFLEEFLARQPSGGGDLRDQEAVGAESLGGALLGVDAQALDGRAHQHHAGHADDHAEQGEEAAQFMRSDGVQAQADCGGQAG